MLSRPLPLMQGGKLLAEFWRENPQTVLVFYKQSCQTCLFLLPFLNDFYRRLPHPVNNLLLISQDSPEESREFARRMSLVPPIAIDYPEYIYSKYFDFTAVPAIFLISSEGNILQRSEGFWKEEFVDILESWKRANRFDAVPVFDNPEKIPLLKPG